MPYVHKQYGFIILFLISWIASFVALALFLLGPIIPIIVFACLLAVIAYLFHGLTIRVDDSAISWGFGPGVFGKKVLFSEIKQVSTVTNSFRHGIGVRITHDGWVYSVHGFSAVALELLDGTFIRLGTNDQDTLVSVLNEQLKAKS